MQAGHAPGQPAIGGPMAPRITNGLSAWHDPRHELELKSLMLDRSVDGLVAYTTDGRLVYVNRTAASQLGRTSEELMLMGPWGWVPPGGREDAAARMRVLRSRGSMLYMVHGVSATEAPTHLEVHATLVRSERGDLVVSTIRDVTDRIEAHERVRHLAFHDRLTGLANRARLEDDLRCALAQADRHSDLVGIVYIDLDDFKPVNDALGHAAGDEVLRVVAARMLGCVRECDTVARLGGDEFLVLINRLNEPADLAAVGCKLVEAVENPIDLGERTVWIQASAGLALYDRGEAAEDLMNRADHAMYRAKQLGIPGWDDFLASGKAANGRT